MTDFPNCADLSKYIGKPFCWQTYNCWQFVVDFYAEAGIELKDYTPKDLTLKKASQLFDENVTKAGFAEVAKPKYGDVCLFKGKRDGIYHVGVWVEDVIHCASTGAGQVRIEELFFIIKRFESVTYWRWQQ